MKIFGFDISRSGGRKQAPFESALMRLVAAQDGYWGGTYGAGLYGSGFGAFITPENCMSSPTVQAIVTAVTRRVAVSPCELFQRKQQTSGAGADPEDASSAGRMRTQRVANHPVEKLLLAPNDWQTRTTYWMDAVSRYLRYGNYFAYKSRGATGPIRELLPIRPLQMHVEQDLNTWAVNYRVNGELQPVDKIHHARGPSRNGILGDSPIMDVNATIALEVAAEQFGASFFNNGALPLMIFRYAQGMQAFKNAEDEKQFVTDFQNALGGNRRHRALLLPKGVETDDPVKIENDKAQFLETRKYQRTVIAAAFGVPPHLVGDLERATFNNVEQQSADFTINVVLPVVQCFESAMERDLLTDADRAKGIIIRFNMDAVQRVDFKTRQEGLRIQHQEGVICANDWRELEGMNPIPDEDGGEDFIRPLNFGAVGDEPQEDNQPGAADNANEDEPQDGDTPAAGARPNGNGAVSDKPTGTAKRLALADSFEARFRSLAGEFMELLERFEQRGRQTPIVIHLPEQPATVVNVQPPDVKVVVESPHINIATPPVHVEAPIVTVEPPDVNVKVEPAQVNVTTPEVKVEGPTIHVEPPQIHAPIKVEAPVVNIEPAQILVDAAARPVDRVVERGEDGRLVAIRSRPAAKG